MVIGTLPDANNTCTPYFHLQETVFAIAIRKELDSILARMITVDYEHVSCH